MVMVMVMMMVMMMVMVMMIDDGDNFIGDHFDDDDDAAVDEGMKVFLPPPQAQPAEEPSKTQHYRKRNVENNF